MTNFTCKIPILIVMLILASCNSGNQFSKTPVDNFIRDMATEEVFTIMLYDMNVEGNFSKQYYHQYQIITERDSIPQTQITEWHQVSQSFFERHIDNMGMEIVAKTRDGKINKTPAPPGYNNYVGNQQYGQWRTGADGSSFWEFYGKYAMISSVFHMLSYPAYRNSYTDFSRNYRGRQPYYGATTGGKNYYGTSSNYVSSNRKNSSWTSKASNQSFQQRVRSRVSPSNSRVTRSGSRYNSRTSTRSRSSSFGK